MSRNNPTAADIDAIDALLPQTQCGLCGFDGCHPYAEALAAGTHAINLCPPGGLRTLHRLAQHLKQDAQPYEAAMAQETKAPTVAWIDPEACIGCTKCIQACPVDAIMGASKRMHTVISSECTGCDLCMSPCPVDCIHMLPVPGSSAQALDVKADLSRQRFQARQQRLEKQSIDEQHFYEHTKQASQIDQEHKSTVQARKQAIAEAVARVKQRRG